jgi:NAD(P)H dehydrogenase (quinone)
VTRSSSPRPQFEDSSTTTAAATRRPVVLVTGATGRIGGHLVDALRDDPAVDLRAAVRRPEQAEQFAATGVQTVHLDLDDYDGFAQALAGVDRLFLIAGYTVDMLAQGKAIVDSARAAGVQHIVHIGTFTQPGRPMARYVGHMLWHQLVESYIEASGLGFTHLRPNVFMQAILGAVHGNTYRGNWGDGGAVGWVDGVDIARVAAQVLREPGPHAGASYYLSTEASSEADIAHLLSEELQRPIRYQAVPLDGFLPRLMTAGMEPAYARCIEQTVTLFRDGVLTDIADVTDDVSVVTGQEPTGLREFIRRNRDAFAG